ncbi:MAG: GNAT family N-acetyltransferase [Candidatus Sulfotelmatobacter sp.]
MGNNRLEIRTYRSLDELQAIVASWEELLTNYPLATTFSTPEWLMSWWRSFGKDQKLLVAGFFAESRLVALAPFSLTRIRMAKTISLRQLRLMGDGSNDSDNLDVPVRPGFEDRFASSLLGFLQSERNSWDFGQLNTLPPQSPGANALRQLLGSKKWLALEKQRPASVIPLPATWEDYLAQLASEDQKNLARYTRRLEKRYAVQVYRCHAESQLPKCLEALFEHHQARWEAAGEQGSFGSKERKDFYYQLSRTLLPQGRLDLWVIELDGAVAAAQFGFRYGSQVFQLQEGNDPQHASDRVGFVLRGHVMKQLIAEGVHTYDFLGGELGYKARWGAQSRFYTDIHFARPFSLGSAYLQAVHNAGQSKAWLREHLPKPAWDALHRINLHARGRRTDRAASRSGSQIGATSQNDSLK